MGGGTLCLQWQMQVSMQQGRCTVLRWRLMLLVWLEAGLTLAALCAALILPGCIPPALLQPQFGSCRSDIPPTLQCVCPPCRPLQCNRSSANKSGCAGCTTLLRSGGRPGTLALAQ